MHQRWESLLAVDEGIERIVEKLRETRELDNTYVIFTSDHGYMQGEHRIPRGEDAALRRLHASAASHSRPWTPAWAARRRPWWATSISRRRSWTRLPRTPRARWTAARCCRSRATSGCGASVPSFTRRRARARAADVNTREGGARGTQTARAGMERGTHDSVALRRVQGRAARAVRPQAGPLGEGIGGAQPEFGPCGTRSAAPSTTSGPAAAGAATSSPRRPCADAARDTGRRCRGERGGCAGRLRRDCATRPRSPRSRGAARAIAEREGFEPSMEVSPHTRLAGECLQPLGHLSRGARC